MITSYKPLSGDLARNPGMCPDWESNQRPFGSQVGAQSTEPHQLGLPVIFLMHRYIWVKNRITPLLHNMSHQSKYPLEHTELQKLGCII